MVMYVLLSIILIIAVLYLLWFLNNKRIRIKNEKCKWESVIKYHLNCLKTFNRLDNRDSLKGMINASANGGESLDLNESIDFMDEEKEVYQ